MFFNLLGDANDDLDRATVQPHENHRAHATVNVSRCSRTKTSSGSPDRKSCFHPETENEVLRASSETISPSHGPLEHVVDGDFRKQLVLSVPLYISGGWKSEFKTSSLTSTILNLIFAEAGQKGKTQKFPYVHRSQIGWFECRQAVSRFEVPPSEYFNPITT